MAKLTVLEMVNDLANDLDTENVNSLNDTIESIQIAQILRTTYFELIANRNWPHLRRSVQLDSLNDLDTPTHLRLVEGTKELITLSYNKATEEDPTRPAFSQVEYLEPEEFILRTNRRNTDQLETITITELGGIPLLIINDKQPDWYTSFDDEHVVFDSYNVALENTIQSSNTQAVIYQEPIWTHLDSFVPDLPSEAFPLLVAEAKSSAFLVIRQESNAKSEQQSRRQSKWLSRKAFAVSGGVGYPNYGRK